MFLESYRSKRLPENLDIYFGPPEEFFIAPDTQERYTQNRWAPILDDGNFGLVIFLDPSKEILIQMDVESPEESQTVFQRWQQYLASLMIRIGETENDDTRLRQIAEMVGFSHTDALFEYFAHAESIGDDAWWEARRQFPLSIQRQIGSADGGSHE